MKDLLINSISSIGLLFSVYLVKKKIKEKNYCPRIINIPACYIVLLSFSVILISKTIIRNHFLYFAGSITGLLLGMWFSYHEIKKNKKCPRFFGIPLCYVSLLAFTLILLLKFFL